VQPQFVTRLRVFLAVESEARPTARHERNSVTSTGTLADGSARQLFTSGAVNINLTTSGVLVAYVTVGAGVASLTGNLPTATPTGNYRFRLGTGPPIAETDTVTVHDAREECEGIALLSGASLTVVYLARCPRS